MFFIHFIDDIYKDNSIGYRSPNGFLLIGDVHKSLITLGFPTKEQAMAKLSLNQLPNASIITQNELRRLIIEESLNG